MRPDFNLLVDNTEIYMDNAATTALDEDVIYVMRKYFQESYGNPETVYRLGRESKKAVDDARAAIADVIKCDPEELFFTSGGTESNNWAIKGAIWTKSGCGGRIISSVEHSSVIEPAKWASQDSPYFEVPVDQYGVVDLVELESELKSGQYFFVSIQYANNEIGTIQPVEKIAALCKKYGAIFHCDAVQALGKIDFDVDDIGADMISLSAHKIHGPMGVGALYVKKGTPLEPLIHGGGQERGMRSGTSMVPEIVGFGKAVEIASMNLKTHMPRLMKISEWLCSQMCLDFNAKRNGHPTLRLPNIINVTIPKMEAEVVCGIMCSKYNTCLSAGAACSTSKRTSHVLTAIGLPIDALMSTLRISLSKYNPDSDLRVLFGRLQAARREAVSRSLI